MIKIAETKDAETKEAETKKEETGMAETKMVETEMVETEIAETKVIATEIIETGMLKNREDGLLYPYEMRKVDIKNLKEIMDLQHEVLDTMVNPEVCVHLTEPEVKEIFNGTGEILGVYADGTFIGFGASLFPGKREDNLGIDIGLKDDELMKVAHLEFAVVHPLYRGNSLQKKIAGHLVKNIEKSGKFDYLMNTISPYNPVSLDTGFYLGFMIKKLTRKYGGILRYILVRHINKSMKVDRDTLVSIKPSELVRQEELMNKGYYGVEFEDGRKSGNILYGKVALK